MTKYEAAKDKELRKWIVEQVLEFVPPNSDIKMTEKYMMLLYNFIKNETVYIPEKVTFLN